MVEKSFKSILEDSIRNKFLFYYSGTSVCCKEISKDGLSRDTIIASQVSDNFLTAIDLQDNIYVACINNEKGIYLFAYENNQWKLDQVLNIQGSGSIFLLSLFAHNSSTHIIYAKQMTIANFYNIHHLFKPGGPHGYHNNSSWKKNNIGEVYAENIDSAYSAIITRDGIIHLVNEWYDGNSYLINYSWYDNGNDTWKKKPITNLYKKDIKVSILYEESTLHLLCYTFEDEISAVFYYAKKEGPGKDFEFSCLDKIKTDTAISPYFHIESGYIFISWLQDKRYGQYSLNKELKNWSKKFDNLITSSDAPQVIEYIRNRKGKSLINKKTYFNIDYKHNISLPYFKDNSPISYDFKDSKQIQNAEGDLIRYIPYLLDEIKSLSEVVKNLESKIEYLEGRKVNNTDARPATIAVKSTVEQKMKQNENNALKKSSFKDQFMSTNKLIGRPDATALYVPPSSIPNPDELSKKEEIKFVENNETRFDEKVIEKQAYTHQAEPERTAQDTEIESPKQEIKVDKPKQEIENNTQKDVNLFKKIGDFFK
ncbi:MAG: hypothetical protein K0S75_2545 [Clostridia bacterium]|jgi:hypothetical protein|nr:hypothetical protein [Clostridia bacterium]